MPPLFSHNLALVFCAGFAALQIFLSVLIIRKLGISWFTALWLLRSALLAALVCVGLTNAETADRRLLYAVFGALVAVTFVLRFVAKPAWKKSADMVRIEAARRRLLIIQAVYLGVIGLLIWLGEQFSRQEPTEINRIYVPIVVLAVAEAAALALIQIRMIRRSEKKLREDPNDAISFGRWRLGHVISFAICVAITLHGFVLRMLGWTFNAALPFYAGGIVLLLFSTPREPMWSDPETRTGDLSGEK